MLKKISLIALLLSVLLLTGCVENRYGTPADEVLSDETVTDGEVTEDEEAEEESEEGDEGEEESVEDSTVNEYAECTRLEESYECPEGMMCASVEWLTDQAAFFCVPNDICANSMCEEEKECIILESHPAQVRCDESVE